MNRIKIIFIIVVVLVVGAVLLMLTGILPGLNPSNTVPFTLEVWGPDDPELWRTIIDEYRLVVPGATINYIQKKSASYENEFVNALASGDGPDIFMLPDRWLAKHHDKISPLRDGQMGYKKSSLDRTFADTIAESISDENGALLGTPLAFDTLALFYNRDYFNSANIPSPPSTWPEVIEDAGRLTKFSEVGGIVRSGIALGTAANVEHAADILLALIYQNGGRVLDASTKSATLNSPSTESAISFYTSFSSSVKKSYAWNAFFGNSLTAFARGEVAMALGYASDVPKIVAVNPQLNFDVAPFPQASGSDVATNFGRFNVLTVSRISRERENAWNFLLWLQNAGPQKKYSDGVGIAPARRDLVNAKPPRDYLVPFYDQALSGRVIPILVGDSIDTIIRDMIEGVITRRFSPAEAMSRADNQINDLLRASP